MRRNLRIVTGYPNRKVLHIIDDSNKVVAVLPRDERSLAEEICRQRFSPLPWKWWWGRDARQRAYDRWIWQRDNQ